MAQTAVSFSEKNNDAKDVTSIGLEAGASGLPGELSRNEAQSLLRLLSPSTTERNVSDTNLLPTPNGGQLYVQPNLQSYFFG